MSNAIDRKLAHAIQRWGNAIPGFWRFFARFALYAYIVAGVCFAWFMPIREWLAMLVFPAFACYVATVVVQLIVRRPRPHQLPQGFNLWIHTYSFPSAHASSSFACAVLLSDAALRIVPEAAPVFIPATFIVATGIALSRVVVGVHYPSDVAAGFVWGTALSLLFVLA